MTLERRTVNLQLTGGLNEHVDPRVAISPLVLKNCRYRKAGGLQKRYGSAGYGIFNARYNASVAPSSAPPTPQLLTTRGDELVRVGSGELDTVSAAIAGGSKDSVYRGDVPPCVLRKAARIGGAFGVGDSLSLTPNTGTFSGRLLIASAYPVYTANTGARTIYLDIEDASTGLLVTSRLLVASGTTVGVTVKLAQKLNTIFVVYVNGTNLQYQYIDLTTTIALSGATTITTCVSATQYVDAAATNGSTAAEWKLYTITVGNAGADYKVSYVDSGGTTSTNAVTLTQINAVAIRADYLDTYYYVLVGDYNAGTTTVYGRRFTPGGSVAAAAAFSLLAYSANPSTIQAAIGRYSDSLHLFAWSDNATNTLYLDKRNNSDTAQFTGTTRKIGAATDAAVHRPTTLLGQPFMYGSKVYAPVMTVQYSSSTGTDLGTAGLVDTYTEIDSATVNTFQFVGSALPVQLARADGFTAVPKSFAVASGYAFNVRVTDTTVSSPTSSDLVRLVADFTFVPPQMAVANGSGILAGGVPTVYDGQHIVESGFLSSPAINTSPTQSTAGSLTQLSTYSYCAIFSQYDANGNVHRSPVSNVVTLTLTGANDDVTLAVSCLHATNRKATVYGAVTPQVWVELYRTLANGSTFHLQGKYASTINAANVSILDTTSDTSLQTMPLLYTTGGVLESQSPPSASYVFRAQDRIWLCDTDDGTVWFSDTIAAGEAPRFNVALTVPAPKEGRYTSGAQLDANVVLFTEDSIDILFGDGPDSTGTGSFSQRTRVAADVGCVDGRSITTTPYGVFFQSRDGLCLLDRSLQVRRIGKSVEDSTGQASGSPYDIVAAVNIPDQSEVRFPLAVTNTQRAIVFDLEEAADPQNPNAVREVWSVDEWTCPIAGTPRVASACFWNGKYTWITSTGYVFQDSYSTYLDTSAGSSSVWVTLSVQTSHWNSQGLASWMSVFGAGALLEYLTDHDVTISVYRDWATSSPEVATWVHADVTSARSSAREELLVMLATQNCQSVSVKISDAAPTSGTVGTGQGFRISGIPIELGPRAGLFPLPEAARKGGA